MTPFAFFCALLAIAFIFLGIPEIARRISRRVTNEEDLYFRRRVDAAEASVEAQATPEPATGFDIDMTYPPESWRALTAMAEHPTPPTPDLLAVLREGIEDARAGRVVDLGSFAQYADDDRPARIRAKTDAVAIPILPGFDDPEETETYGNPPKDAA